MSASSTTSLGNSSPNADKVLPKASRRESLLAIRAGLDIHEPSDFVGARAQRRQRLFGLRWRELDAAMPGRDVFHVRHALAFDGMGDQDGRFFACRTSAAQMLENFGNIVAVDFGHRPANGAPF